MQVIVRLFQDARTFVVRPRSALPQRLDYNLYHGPGRWEHDRAAHKAFDAFRKAAGEEHSKFADPLLADGRPRAGSPAIDTGLATPEVTADIDGAIRAAPDIGACEAAKP